MDKTRIIEMAKARGLDLAEDVAENLIELAIDIVGEVIKSTSNKYDDMLFAAMEGKIREQLANMADKIDGKND